jgi:hypothetical protein
MEETAKGPADLSLNDLDPLKRMWLRDDMFVVCVCVCVSQCLCVCLAQYIEPQ